MVTSYILYIENHFAVCRYWPHGRRQEYFQSIHSLPQFIHNWQDSIPISICHFLHTGLCCCHSSNLFQLLNGIISLFGFFCYLLNQILFYASANINALLYSNCISQFLGVSQASRNVLFLCHVNHGQSFNVDGLRVRFQQDFNSCFDFSFREDTKLFKQLDILSA